MNRRSFIGILSAAFTAPKLPGGVAEPPIGSFRGKLRLVADEMAELPAPDITTFLCREAARIGPQIYRRALHTSPLMDPITKTQKHEDTIPETGRIKTEAD